MCLVPCLVALRCWSLRADATAHKGSIALPGVHLSYRYPHFPGAEGGRYKVSLSYQSDNVRAPQSLSWVLHIPYSTEVTPTENAQEEEVHNFCGHLQLYLSQNYRSICQFLIR